VARKNPVHSASPFIIITQLDSRYSFYSYDLQFFLQFYCTMFMFTAGLDEETKTSETEIFAQK